MGKKNKKGGDGGGLPGWFATFSDMMTLLFAFFVLLFSLSTIDPVKVAAFSEGKKGGDAKPDPTVKEKLDLAEIKDEFQKMVKDLNMDSSATVSQDPRGIALEIDGDICFESSQVEIKPKLRQVLDKAIEGILTAENDIRPVVVEGHTDSYPMVGKMAKIYPTNWELSSGRAAEVVKYLIAKGVNSTRLSPTGYADRWPFGVTWKQKRSGEINQELIDAMNATKELRRKNRRIKIIIGPNY
tara:strand:+ start:1507 stop:2229 length:723 start_codon:yes stop_codon:yes gene_type:complete